MPTGILRRVVCNHSRGFIVTPDDGSEVAFVYCEPVVKCCMYLPVGTKVQFESMWFQLEHRVARSRCVTFCISVEEARLQHPLSWPGLAQSARLPPQLR